MRSANEDKNPPLTLVDVLKEELNLIGATEEQPEAAGSDGTAGEKADDKTAGNQKPDTSGDDHADLNVMFSRFYDRGFSALCFSGGGIRSATFGLGVVEALAGVRVLDKFDYLSTVSGGGYLGSWLSAWIRRERIRKFDKQLLELRKRLADEKKNANARSGPTDTKEAKDARKKAAKELEDTRDEALKQLQKDIYKEYQEFQGEGVARVQTIINDHRAEGAAKNEPFTEPKQVQALREYSNYMTPRVGLLSADTWTFIGIYLRNLFLNWTIFVPLIAAVLLVPKIFEAFVKHGGASWKTVLALGVGAVVMGCMTLAAVIVSLPSSNPQVDKPGWSTDGGVVTYALAPLLIMAFVITTLVFWYLRGGAGVGEPGGDSFFFFPLNSKYARIWLVALPVAAYVIIKLAIFGYEVARFLTAREQMRTRKELWARLNVKRMLGTAAAAAAASVIGALVIAAVLAMLKGKAGPTGEQASTIFADANAALYLTVAVPAFLGIFLAAATVFVGFASKVQTDGDREWFARFGSWILISCVGWVALCGFGLYGPAAIHAVGAALTNPNIGTLNFTWAGLDVLVKQLVPIVAVVSGLLSLVGGFTGKSNARKTPAQGALDRFLSTAPQIAAVVFLAFLLSLIAWLAEYSTEAFGNAAISLNKIFDPDAAGPGRGSIEFYLLYASTLFAAALAMACLLNVNKFSLHGAYRDRLIRAYLGASKKNRRADPFTGFDDMDNFQLHRLKGQRPFHVVNATLNLVDGEKLAWQNRKAATFTMTPLHCGSWALEGYRRTFEYSRNTELGVCGGLDACNKPVGLGGPCIGGCEYPGKSIRLGTAMAISGAAVNPNMGYYSSPVVMFLMGMFNIRLGWWLGNTNKKGARRDWFGLGRPYFTKPSPTIAIMPLISETFGRTDKERLFVNVSDGGHFENLGLYEMVLRRCKFILLSDAAADNTFAFDDLANAIEKCEVDLGVKIEFENGIKIPSRSLVSSKKKKKKARIKREWDALRYAVARIKYPENTREDPAGDGLLLYIKPSFHGNEPVELKHYAEAHPTFPHQSTGDQMFDEKQFEAYRELGYFTMMRMLDELKPARGDLGSIIDGVTRIAARQTTNSRPARQSDAAFYKAMAELFRPGNGRRTRRSVLREEPRRPKP